MRVELSSRSEKQFTKLPAVTQMAVARKIRQIQNKENMGSIGKKLSGTRGYRIRVGDYRIVYRKKTKNIIRIVIIEHRRDVYKVMKRMFG